MNDGPLNKNDMRAVNKRPSFLAYFLAGLFSGSVIVVLVAVIARVWYELFLWGWSLMGWAT